MDGCMSRSFVSDCDFKSCFFSVAFRAARISSSFDDEQTGTKRFDGIKSQELGICCRRGSSFFLYDIPKSED